MSDLEAAFNSALAGAESDGDNGADIQIGDAGATVFRGDEVTFDEPDTDVEGVEESGTEEVYEDTDGAPSDSSFDWATYKDHLVTVKVQGQEIQVPLGEALNGYMRQADYTKKTQANSEALKMAEWAQQLRDAINSDPAGTIKYLQEAYGIAGSKASEDIFDEIDPDLQPLVATVKKQEQALQAMQAQLEAVQQERILNEVRSELQTVQAEFPDLDPYKVLPVAAERGLSIRDAYLLVESENIIASKSKAAQAAAEAQKVAEREAVKRKNASKVAGTTNVAGSAKSPMPEFNSFEDMLNWNMKNAKTLI